MPTFTFRLRLPYPSAHVLAWLGRPGAAERLAPPWEPAEGAELAELAEGDALRPLQTVTDTPDGCELVEAIEGPTPGPWASILPGETFAARLEREWRFRHRRLADDLARHAQSGLGPSTIAVTGASGLVGRQLVPFLTSGGHDVIRFVRHSAGAREARWDPTAKTIDGNRLEGADAVIHLSGESIFGRWTPSKQAQIRESRVASTRLLAETLPRLRVPPRVLIAASAVGYYGDAGERPVDERAPAGHGFLADLCRDWEAATVPAALAGIRVVNLRFGIVLTARGGALAQLLTPATWGLGGPLGSGRQFYSWVSLDDLLGMVAFAIGHALQGPVNATGPDPLSQASFARTLGSVVGRPAFLPLPAPAVKLLFGRMGEEMLLWGANARPEALVAAGFRHANATLEDALRLELGRLPG